MKQFVLATSLVGLGLACGCGQSTTTQIPAAASAAAANHQQTADETANGTANEAPADRAADLKSRRFTFHYRFKVKDLKPADDASNNVARVWLPVAQSGDEQTVKRLVAVAPADVSEATDDRFGNRILFFETQLPPSGEFAVDVPYEVERREVLRGPSAPRVVSAAAQLDSDTRNLFLGADAMVPTSGRPLKLLDMVELVQDKFARARQLYDLVDNHVAYKKEGTQWGRGDTNWVCDSGFGNCTDFHSLFISLARSQGLPARFEIGFSIPTDKPQGPIAGYHCWAWFYADERGWVPVDISEADKNPTLKDYYFGGLTPDRVTFSVGRDIPLTPKSESQPLNFFIYPHIEVGGKVLPREHVELQFVFKDNA